MKYNDNGTYRDLYIKSFDTVPIGTVVDFNGTNIPDGWTEINDKTYKSETYSLSGKTVTAGGSIELGVTPTISGKTFIGAFIKNGVSIIGLVGTIIDKSSNKIYLLCSNAQTFGNTSEVTITYMYETPKIRKTNQYINGGASLSSIHGTSSNNGYTQEYLNDKLVHVGPEIDDNSKTNIVLSNNLCNISLFGLFPNLSGTVESQAYNNAIIDTRNITSLYVSGDFSLLADGMLRVGKYNTYPVIGSTGTRLSINTSRVIDTSDANYVLLAFAPTGGKTIEQIKNSFMVNKGNTAQPYQPYIAPTINVDSEDIYVKGQNEVYSTQEQRIGTWIDGKPLYRRVLESGILNANEITLLTITNEIVAKIEGYFVLASTGVCQQPYGSYMVDAGRDSRCLCDGTAIKVQQGSGWQGGYHKARVIIEYTKITD